MPSLVPHWLSRLTRPAWSISARNRVVVASSDKAYGDLETLPYTEDMPLQGSHPYDASKSCADHNHIILFCHLSSLLNSLWCTCSHSF